MRRLFLITAMGITALVNAQHIRPLKDVTEKLSTEELRLIAEKLYAEHHYYAALEYYDRLGNETKHSTQDQFNLAQIKHLLNDYAGAMSLYEKLNAVNSEPEIDYALGNLYKIQKQPEKARDAFQEVINNTSSSMAVRNKARYQLENLSLFGKIQNSVDQSLSVKSLDNYSGIRSTRFEANDILLGEGEEELRVKKKININSDLTIELDTVLMNRLIRINSRGVLNKLPVQLKLPSYSLSSAFRGITDNQLFFDAYDVLEPTARYAIYAVKDNGKGVQDPSPLNSRINAAGYSSRDPMLAQTSNGELFLFYSSNRPGGFGGYDLWMSQFVRGQFTQPINLGAGINTAEDERTPFFDTSTGYLFFSSKGHAGLGAMDIFLTRVNWGKGRGKVFNLGKPYNTPFNDLYFSLNNEGRKGTFTSNRADHCCYQPYTFKLVTPFSYSELPSHFVEVEAFDQFDSELLVLRQSFNYEALAFNDTKTEFILKEDADLEGKLLSGQVPISRRKILLVDTRGEVVSSTISDTRGEFKFRQLPAGGQYSFIMEQSDPQLTVDVKLINQKGSIFGRLNNKEEPDLFRFKPLENYLAGVWRLDIPEATISGELVGSALKEEKILLVDEEGRVVATSQTDDRGKFLFKNLPAGEKYAFVLRARDTPITVNVDIRNELGQVIRSFSSKSSKELFKYRKLEDYEAGSWTIDSQDAIISGSLVAGTLTIGNQKVLLLDENGKLIGVSYTDKKGVFTFKELPAGKKLSFLIDESDTEFNIDVAILDENGNITTRFSSNNRQEVFKYKELKEFANGYYTIPQANVAFNGIIGLGNSARYGQFIALTGNSGEIIELAETTNEGNFAFNGLEKEKAYAFILPSGYEDKKVEIKVMASNNRIIEVLDNQLNAELFRYQDMSSAIDKYYAQSSTICGQFTSMQTGINSVVLVNEYGEELACVDANNYGYFQISDVPFFNGYQFMLDGCNTEAILSVEVVNAVGATTASVNTQVDTEYFVYQDLNLSSVSDKQWHDWTAFTGRATNISSVVTELIRPILSKKLIS